MKGGLQKSKTPREPESDLVEARVQGGPTGEPLSGGAVTSKDGPVRDISLVQSYADLPVGGNPEGAKSGVRAHALLGNNGRTEASLLNQGLAGENWSGGEFDLLCSYYRNKAHTKAGAFEAQRPTPQALDALAAGEDREGAVGESARLPARVERYGKARRMALETLAYLDAAVVDGGQSMPYDQGELRILKQKAGELRDCGSWLHFRDYFTVDVVRLHSANFCRVHLLCPLCAIRRGAKALGAYLERFRAIQRVNPGIRFSLVTYTVKDGPDLLERFNHLRGSLELVMARRRNARGVNRHKTEWAKVLGVVGSFEFKRGKNSGDWHPHAHMIVLHTERLDANVMREEWKRITGDSHVLRIDPARHPKEPERDFVEVFKYALKFSEMSRADNVEGFLRLQARRLLFSAGEFWGVKVPEDLKDGRQGLEGLLFLDLFYRYLDGAGYSLAAVGKPGEWAFTGGVVDGVALRVMQNALLRRPVSGFVKTMRRLNRIADDVN